MVGKHQHLRYVLKFNTCRMLQGLVQMGPKPDRFRAMNPDYESPYVNKQDALVRLGCYQSLGGPPETESGIKIGDRTLMILF